MSVPIFALVDRKSPCSHDLKHSNFGATFPQLLHHPGKIQRQGFLQYFPQWPPQHHRVGNGGAVTKKIKTFNSKAEQMNDSHNTYKILKQRFKPLSHLK